MEKVEFRCLNTVTTKGGYSIVCSCFLGDVEYSAYAFPMSQFVFKTRCRRCRSLHFIYLDPTNMKLGIKLIPHVERAQVKGTTKSSRNDAESPVIGDGLTIARKTPAQLEK